MWDHIAASMLWQFYDREEGAMNDYQPPSNPNYGDSTHQDLMARHANRATVDYLSPGCDEHPAYEQPVFVNGLESFVVRDGSGRPLGIFTATFQPDPESQVDPCPPSSRTSKYSWRR